MNSIPLYSIRVHLISHPWLKVDFEFLAHLGAPGVLAVNDRHVTVSSFSAGEGECRMDYLPLGQDSRCRIAVETAAHHSWLGGARGGS
ncbi:MAG TPA: hypothetical protein VL992_10615 [Tepidisphaeraceae bacterium]|nr:hypothetical protein [Tepidisphaeraceae bacterium]